MSQQYGQMKQEHWGISPITDCREHTRGKRGLFSRKILAGGFMGAFLGCTLTLLIDEPAHADWIEIRQRVVFQDLLGSEPVEIQAVAQAEPSLESSKQALVMEAGLTENYRRRIPAWGKPQRKIRVLDVTATAYNNVPAQTDSTPDIAAWGDRIEPGMPLIAVSRDLLKRGLKRGMKVRVSGLEGEFIVLDKMNKRYKKRIDIYMGKNISAARQFGKRQVTLSWSNVPSQPASTLVAKR